MKLKNEDNESFGPEWSSLEEMQSFIEWHEEGEQRTIFETFEDGDLENQIEWWRDGGHLLKQE